MRSRLVVLAWCAAVAGCDVEGKSRPGETPREVPGEGGFSFQMRPDSAAPAGHSIFDRRREDLFQGVARLTVSVVVLVHEGRAAVRAALEQVVEEERSRDSTVAAIRVLAFAAPAPGAPGSQAPLEQIGSLEWVPLTGWEDIDNTSRAAVHRSNIVFTAPLPESPMLPPHAVPGVPVPPARPR